MIRIWQSFACNNSSSYRLVGRFASAEDAAAAEREMRAFFADPDPMLDAVTRPGSGDVALAARYGLLLDVQSWRGADWPVYDETIEIGTAEEVLVVYHHYCLGFSPALPEYLKDRGAHVDRQDRGAPTISLMFARTPALEDDVDELLRTIDAAEGTGPIAMPWGESPGRAVYFRDANTVGLLARIEPSELGACRAWFAERGASPVLRLCDDGDEARFATIAAARCASCGCPLEYLDPRLHDIEAPQLLCRSCGGLYELGAFES